MRRLALSVAAGACLAALLAGAVSGAQQAFPGRNGKLFYSLGADIYSANADGSGATRLTSTPDADSDPDVTKDGKRVAFVRCASPGVCGIWTMSADGSGSRAVVSTGKESGPAWPSDGRRIVFVRTTGSTTYGGQFVFANTDVFVVNADGSGETQLTSSPSHDAAPAWCPTARASRGKSSKRTSRAAASRSTRRRRFSCPPSSGS